MDKAGDRPNAKLTQTLEPRVVPSPLGLIRPIRRDRLPQNRVAERADAERRDGIEILEAFPVPRLDGLVAELVANPDDRALESAPEFRRVFRHHQPAFANPTIGPS
jgi:hypothetical protein